MKLAFSTVACPTWDFETIVARAKEYGYDGVELRGFLNETVLTASNVFLTDPAKVRKLFADNGLGIACLSSSVAMADSKKENQRLAGDVRQFIEMAEALGTGLVKIFDAQVRPGQSRASAGVALGDWLAPLGDFAAEHGVTLVVENALSFRAAKEMWTILDRLGHPSIAACWDLFNAATIGESPLLSVPVLNSRIQYTQVKDATFGALGATYCKLGDGEVPVQKFLTRLMGIGYQGWVSFEWEKAWLVGLAEPEEILPDAVKKLREWTEPKVEEKKEAKPAAAPRAKAPVKA